MNAILSKTFFRANRNLFLVNRNNNSFNVGQLWGFWDVANLLLPMKKVARSCQPMSDNFSKSEKKPILKRSKKITLRIPIQLYDLATNRATELGYRNVGRYFTGLALIDVLRVKWAIRMRNVSNCDPEAQDFLFDQLSKLPIEPNELIVFLKKILRANIPEKAKSVAKEILKQAVKQTEKK